MRFRKLKCMTKEVYFRFLPYDIGLRKLAVSQDIQNKSVRIFLKCSYSAIPWNDEYNILSEIPPHYHPVMEFTYIKISVLCSRNKNTLHSTHG